MALFMAAYFSTRPVSREGAALRAVAAIHGGDMSYLCGIASDTEVDGWCGTAKGPLGNWLRDSFRGWHALKAPEVAVQPGEAFGEATQTYQNPEGQVVHLRAVLRSERGRPIGLDLINGAIMSAALARRPVESSENSAEGLYRALLLCRAELESIGVHRFPSPDGGALDWDQLLAKQGERARMRSEREATARKEGRL
ncbi:hypothetical protein EON81_23540 [bacterium]|nr:MAG: hypothetical protein EON81_23540 [bacterium]